jgi:hypothetical protein
MIGKTAQAINISDSHANRIPSLQAQRLAITSIRCNTYPLNQSFYQGVSMKRILIISSILLLSACSVEPGSEKWCATQKEQPKSEWTGSDARTYAKNCVIDGMAVGSEEWCEDLSSKPKGEWTADETKTYAKHCVI